MSTFNHLIQVLKGMLSTPSDEEREALFNETLMLTLSRATKADTNISHIEVETVQRVYKEETGIDIESKDVRVAALSELYEEQSLVTMLSKVRVVMDRDSHLRIANALAAVIRADEKVSPFEIEFFNGVIKALGLSASDLAL